MKANIKRLSNLRSKNVLILTYYYPPANFIAGRRAYGISKYLGIYGWSPYVMTIDWTNHNINMMGIDQSAQGAIKKQTNVIRLPYRANKTYPFLERLRRWGRTFLYPPKSFYDYYAGAIRMCSSFIEEKQIAAVWATYPGAATHLIAHEIKNNYNIPWIADFRDLWDQKYSGMAYFLFRLRFILPKLVKNSFEITTVSDGLADKLSRITDRKINIVYNGYDPDEYGENDVSCYNKPKFTLVYTGTIIPEMSPLLVFKAAEQLLKHKALNPEDVRLLFYGSGRKLLSSLLDQSGITHICQISDPVPHSDIPAIQKNATVLLHMSHPKKKGIMTGKIFEYLAARRPILSVPGDNDCVQKLLSETNAGCCRATVNAIANQIKAWYDEWLLTGQVKYSGVETELEKYSYRETARQIAAILDRILQ